MLRLFGRLFGKRRKSRKKKYPTIYAGLARMSFDFRSFKKLRRMDNRPSLTDFDMKDMLLAF